MQNIDILIRLSFHSHLKDVVKASWNTSLSDQSEINERGFVSENSQIGFLMSTDPVLTDAGYNHSFAMIDFKSVSSCVKFYDKPNFLKHGYKNHTKSVSLSFRNSAYSIFLNTVHVLINKNLRASL